jgi:predicted  nucleic acid-binding Zn-ribbon protein
MALIECTDCHKRISDTAIGCPNCGYVLTREVVTAQKAEQARIAMEEAERAAAAERESKLYKRIAICATVLVFGTLFVAAVVNGVNTSGFQYTSPAPSARDREIRRISDTYGIDISEVRAAAHRVDGRGNSD